jgi:hypothetical protein
MRTTKPAAQRLQTDSWLYCVFYHRRYRIRDDVSAATVTGEESREEKMMRSDLVVSVFPVEEDKFLCQMKPKPIAS